jgi:Na+/phosphate symporter
MKTQTQLAVIEQEIPKYLSLKVTDQPTLQEASTYLVGAKKELKALKADMDTLLDPIEETIDGIKAKYAPRLDALKAVVEALTTQTVTYQTRITNERLAAEQAIADRIKEGKGNLSIESATKRIENLDVVEKKVETEAGGMQFVAYPMCDVEDITKVPMKYHEVNMVAIRAEMKAGNKLPGIKYWTEQRPKNSRN